MANKVTELTVLIDTMEKVKGFVQITSQFDSDIDLVGGRYVIDAKSILGIFSLDITKPLALKIEGPEAESEEIVEMLNVYIV